MIDTKRNPTCLIMIVLSDRGIFLIVMKGNGLQRYPVLLLFLSLLKVIQTVDP